jgi:hypothetical protein
MEILRNTFAESYSPELLTKIAEMMPLTEDNSLLNLLIEQVASLSLNDIEFGRLSITGLQYLLSFTYEKEKPFATREYEVFRYSAILAAKQVSDNAYKIFMELLPTLEQIKNLNKMESKLITDHLKVAEELEPLINFIDFNRIKAQILVDIIEPLKIVPDEMIVNVYRNKALLNDSDLNDTRGIPIYRINESDLFWDESACGSKLIIEDNGKIVQSQSGYSHQSVRAKIALEKKAIFEWDVIIEKACRWAWIGVCASENFDYEISVGAQTTGWSLSSNGCCYNNSKGHGVYYCPRFEDNTKITVHLDMNKRICAFTVNGTKYREIIEWNNLPSKLYPVVSLRYPGRFRI